MKISNSKCPPVFSLAERSSASGDVRAADLTRAAELSTRGRVYRAEGIAFSLHRRDIPSSQGIPLVKHTALCHKLVRHHFLTLLLDIFFKEG